MRPRTPQLLLLSTALAPACPAQVLIDSIPYPEVSQGFWGIHVTPDTIFLADDFSGDIYFSDHSGNFLGQRTTPHDFAHGLIVRPDEYWIAEDYAGDGALLYRVDLSGNALGSWPFPDVLGGASSGIGDMCQDGEAIWYTMYYPDFDIYPYAYAYRWVPGDPAPSDTVPMNGSQPYGIALKGDTLFYVTDNLDGDPERIYAYDLTNEQDLGYVDLPDMATDGDQSPRGMFYDGERLYLIANRQGGNAFAYQTIYIYSFDASTAMRERDEVGALSAFPNPTTSRITINNNTGQRVQAELTDATGRRMRMSPLNPGMNAVDLTTLAPGTYLLHAPGTASLRILVN